MTTVVGDILAHEPAGHRGDASTSAKSAGTAHRPAVSRAPGLRSSPARQRRVPWIAVGLLLVFGAGLGFAAWSHASSQQVDALVLLHDVAAGDVVAADDVGPVPVHVGAGVGIVPATDRHAVVGEVARGPIAAGTLLSPSMLGAAPDLPVGQVVVGAVLAPGAYPTDALSPGDAVRLVATAATSEPGATAEELGAGRVWAVAPVDAPGGSGLFVSLAVPAEQAGRVSNAAAEDRLRLVLLGAQP